MAAALASAGHALSPFALSPAPSRLSPSRLSPLAFDLIIADELAHRDLAPLLARLAVPRVLVVHHLSAWEDAPLRRKASLLASELRCLHRADLVVTPSPWVATRLSRLGVRATVVPPGADRLPALPRAATSSVALLAVGSIIPRKRLLTILDALDRLAAPEVTLDLVGEIRDAAHGAAVRARVARSMYLTNIVRLRGALSPAALAHAYASSSSLVLASSLEGYGMVLTEAIHAGLPVLARRTSAIPGVVADGREALLFDDSTIDAVLRAFVTTPELRAAMTRAADEKRASLPTWAASESRFIEVVCDLRARTPAA